MCQQDYTASPFLSVAVLLHLSSSCVASSAGTGGPAYLRLGTKSVQKTVRLQAAVPIVLWWKTMHVPILERLDGIYGHV